ncbi:MAG TPA: exodeoxyribonuclease V subunit gamma [Egibacteraceae bacterium]|nr:exodeoxyribonuclease V subunit gamma [Egibacteraceae bacterium]
MALQLHRAERADRLVEALAGVVADPLDDPFVPETVAVPTRGVERWLTQRLSAVLGTTAGRADGVCANVDFPFPGRLVGGALAVACGIDRDVDPWLPARSVWPLLDVVEECIEEDWLAALAAHLGAGHPDEDEHRHARRFAAVRHVADLFDRYGVHRPAMVRAWAAGHDQDDAGGPLPADLVWQARLWRCLADRLAAPSPAERLANACEAIRGDPGLLDWPARVSVFGLTRLPASYLDVLRAVAADRDVHLFLLHPSPALWDRVAAATGQTSRRVRRPADPTAGLARNPLLATWGRDAREMQLVLTFGDGHVDRHHPLDEEPATLLGRLQADVHADRVPPGPPLPGRPDPRLVLDERDDSVAVHACHGRARQVEVVRDAIAHLLAADPTLEPRDVVVMCPDIDAFAPLIHATFGAGEHTGEDTCQVTGGDAGEEDLPPEVAPPDLRVRLADRSIRQTNPVLGVVAELLAAADERLTASRVIDLAGREPVRRRFRLDDDDLSRVEEWVAAAGVRWGLDAAHRAPFGLHDLDANTWKAGLDRVLLGVAMSEEALRLVGGALPLDDVDSGDIDLAGRLAELIDRLQAAVAALTDAKPVSAWAETIAAAADALTAARQGEGWQRAGLQRLLDDVVEEACVEGHRSAQPLVLAEVRALLADRLRGRPTRANFRTGHLTMCTLVPMRSVPHRVVCLLGLDDGVFPRKTAPDGDDLVARDPCVGDADPRSEDRQLLLDALLAATDHLLVTYSGRDERTNAVRPPAVPVGELLDVIDRSAVATDDGGHPVPARDRVVVAHPLQPFDERNFITGELVAAHPWSFDTVGLQGARAAAAERAEPGGFLDEPLPPAAADLLELDDLVKFVQHPVKAFLRQRLGIIVSREEPEPDDGLPVELDHLERWGVGQRLVDALLDGADRATCSAAEVARGRLPPGALGAPILDEIGPVAERIVVAARDLVDPGTEPSSVEVAVDLGAGRTLVGTVPGVAGDLLRTITYSRVSAKHRLTAWVRLLALTAGHPDRAFAAATVGRGRGRRVTCVALPALVPDPATRAEAARAQLAVLVDLYDRGMREPLPLYAKTSAAWAQARHDGHDPEPGADGEWTSGWSRQGERWSREDEELEHQLVLGGVVPLRALLEDQPRADEGWHAEQEATRFGRYARRLWSGLLAHEGDDG